MTTLFDLDDEASATLSPVPSGPAKLIVEADGGSRGNPGVAAGGAVVIDPSTGSVIAEIGVFVGVATNNVAEYRRLDPCDHAAILCTCAWTRS
ncbi:MAG TPA: hypothetical protein PLL22_00510, partial [Microbacteriaceae bacterium]|nr:hypothetical protein [Microbacteriaceae bacterium]